VQRISLEGLPTKLCVIVILIILVSTANAIRLNERIEVGGNGTISSQTNAGDNKDRLESNAIGKQVYLRDFNIERDSSKFKTSYTCNNITNNLRFSNNSTYYYILGESATITKHSVSIRSNQSIVSSAMIESKGNKFETNYSITSGYGNITESLTERDEARIREIADTKIVGENLNLNSKAFAYIVYQGYGVDELGKLDMIKDVTDIDRDPAILVTGYPISGEEKAAKLIRRAFSTIEKGEKSPESNETALNYIDEAISLAENPKTISEAWRARGNIHYMQKNYYEAVEDYDEAINYNQENIQAWRNKAVALNESNQTAEAVKFLEIATGKFKKDSVLWLRLALYQRYMGNFNDSLKSVDNAIKYDPESSDAYKLKGIVYSKKVFSGDCNGTCDAELISARDAFKKSINMSSNEGDLTINEYLGKLTFWETNR
jgi:tetratricopeptide (TPR) repeat protein